jgi:hypothetical protein
VHKFTHPCTGLEQRLDQEPVFALAALGGLNQAFDFTLVQSGHGSGVRRFEREVAPHPLDNILRLIIAEMMLAPEGGESSE